MLSLLSVIQNVRGKTITLGAWMWASEPVTVRTPIINDTHQSYFEDIEVGVKPAFYTITAIMREDLHRVNVILTQSMQMQDRPVSVFYDGIILVEEVYSVEHTPEFDNSQAKSGVWNGQSFQNLLRNALDESFWPWINPVIDRMVSSNFPVRPALAMTSLFDWSMADWYYQTTLRNLFHTFWGKFGWGHVLLMGIIPYTFLGFITLIGVAGAGITLLRYPTRPPWEILFIFSLSLIIIWGAALVRGVGGILGGNIFIPSARYAYPVIIPTMGMLVVGWLEVMKIIQNILLIRMSFLYVFYVSFFLVLNTIGLISIWTYYR